MWGTMAHGKFDQCLLRIEMAKNSEAYFPLAKFTQLEQAYSG